MEIDSLIELECLVENIFEYDSLAKIAFDPEEWAHMGYDAYEIRMGMPIDSVKEDVKRGIVFSIRIELAKGVAISNTRNLQEYSFSPMEDMSDEDVLALFKEMLK